MKTISEEYRKEMQNLHETSEFGTASGAYAPLIQKLINQTKSTEILDYGSGRQSLAKLIEPATNNDTLDYYSYEPSIDTELPDPRHLVVCIDVLEHIEPELLDNVLLDLQRVTQNIGMFTIHHGPAMKVLSDGRNAHINQQPPNYWFNKLNLYFEIVNFTLTSKQSSYFIISKIN